MLLIGPPGAGKTGACASLASAGYKLRFADMDNGLDVLVNLLTDPTSKYTKGSIENVDYETLTDPMKTVGGKLVPSKATVWQRFLNLMDDWSPKTTAEWVNKKPPNSNNTSQLGPITSWGSNDILIVDGLTRMSRAALNLVLAMNNRLGQQPHQSDYFTAQEMVESFLAKIYDDSVKCNVIVICHIAYIGEDNGPQQGYPASIGKALSPKIGSYFNSCLMAKTSGMGASQKRKILTRTSGIVELKNSAPLRVKPEYDLETGLAEYFKDVRGG